jgi:threonine/homoserine/homoserine lactone efflux protein
VTPDPAHLLPFLLAILLIELTPGPNMGYLAIVAGRFGRPAGFATIAGVTAGLAFYMLLSVFGLTEVILRAAWLYSLLRWAGVAYLLWLAWDTWRGETPTGPGDIAVEPSRYSLAWRGFLANVLNPKAAVFYIALLPGFTDPARPFAGQALGLGLIHIAVALAIHSAIVLAAARASPLLARLSDGEGARVRAAFAIALALIAVWLAWATRR